VKILRRAWAFLCRDWRQETSYRLSFGLSIFGALFGILTFYFLGQMIGKDTVHALAPYGGDYFAFALIGIAFHSYLQTALRSFSGQIRDAQILGTLEVQLVTPTPVPQVILFSSLFSFLWTSLRVVIFLGLGLLFGLKIHPSATGVALLILLLTVIAFASLGLISASFILAFKRGDPLIWLFSGTSTLLGGLYYPVSVLPDWLRPLSNLLPITWALEAMRRALLTGASAYELRSEIGILALFAGLGVPLGVWIFQRAVRHAMAQGSLGQY
jgi:ABC-2 type transport system permease protein